PALGGWSGRRLLLRSGCGGLWLWRRFWFWFWDGDVDGPGRTDDGGGQGLKDGVAVRRRGRASAERPVRSVKRRLAFFERQHGVQAGACSRREIVRSALPRFGRVDGAFARRYGEVALEAGDGHVSHEGDA